MITLIIVTTAYLAPVDGSSTGFIIKFYDSLKH